jgi:hypothetical protein
MALALEEDEVEEKVELAAAVPEVLGQPESSRSKPNLAFDRWATW